MTRINPAKGLTLLVRKTTFFEDLGIKDAIISMIMFDVDAAAFGESLKLMFCFDCLVTTGVYLCKSKDEIRSMIDENGATIRIFFHKSFPITITNDPGLT